MLHSAANKYDFVFHFFSNDGAYENEMSLLKENFSLASDKTFASHQEFADDEKLTGSIVIESSSSYQESDATLNNNSLLVNGLSPIEGEDCYGAALFRMVVLPVAAALLLLVFSYLIKSWWEIQSIRSAYDFTSPLSHLPLPPGDMGFPIIGETFHWIFQGSRFNSIRRKKYGRIFKTNLIGSNMIRVTGQEHVREILQGEHDKVTTIWPANVRQLLGEGGLVNSVGAIHRLKRKIACKAFTSTALSNYIPLLQSSIASNVKSLSACERPLVYGKMLRLTFDLAARALIGIDSTKTKCNRLVDAFYNLVSNIFSVPLKIPGFGFMKGLKAREEILYLLQEHITNKKKKIFENIKGNEEEESDVKSALDIIIRELIMENIKSQENSEVNNNTIINNENQNSLVDDLTLKELAVELVFAGYFTSASTLTSCILEIARHPQVLKKLEEEMLSHGLLKKEDDQEENQVEIDLRLIHGLTYMEQVLKETLRLRPPVLGGYRKARKTFQLGDYRVPKGWTVIYNIRDTHEYEYEEAKDFEPEIFAPGKSSDAKNKFIPFGGGPRTCIGREYARLIIKLTLIELIRTYRGWNLVKNNPPKMKAIPILHPADGMPCTFVLRRKYGILSE